MMAQSFSIGELRSTQYWFRNPGSTDGLSTLSLALYMYTYTAYQTVETLFSICSSEDQTAA